MESECIIDHRGNKRWYKYYSDIRHRENDLPAVEHVDGYTTWNINDKLHRENGPAQIWKKHSIEDWYLNDIEQFPSTMPLSLYLSYIRWNLKKHGK